MTRGRATDTSRAGGVIVRNALAIVVVVAIVIAVAGVTSRRSGSAGGTQQWMQIGTRPIFYDRTRAERLLDEGRRVEVLDSGLIAGRGLVNVPLDAATPLQCRDQLVRLIVADAWEALYDYRVLRHSSIRPDCLGDRRPGKLPATFDVCPGDVCDDVDHRAVLFDEERADDGLMVVDAHQQRLSRRDLAGGVRDVVNGSQLLSGITAAAVVDGRVYVTTVPSQPERERAQRDGRLAGKLMEIVDGKAVPISSDLDRPVGMAYSRCSGGRLYVADAREDQTVWYFYQQQGGRWMSTGVLASEPADRAATLPVLQGIAVSCPADGDAQKGGEIFAAGPGGLFVYGPDGTLIARFVLSERIAGLTWGPDNALYMTIGHRVARLVTNAGRAHAGATARPSS